MPNEEYQLLLRTPAEALHGRILHSGPSTPALRGLVESLSPAELAAALRDLGGHDQGLGPPHGGASQQSLRAADAQADGASRSRPRCGPGAAVDPVPRRAGGSAGRSPGLCHAARARRPQVSGAGPGVVGSTSSGVKSTQAGLCGFLLDLRQAAPEAAARVVTPSPDVASSTSLGGWINRTGVWSVDERRDWSADDTQRLVRWVEGVTGQHIELGIAETLVRPESGRGGVRHQRRPAVPGPPGSKRPSRRPGARN